MRPPSAPSLHSPLRFGVIVMVLGSAMFSLRVTPPAEASSRRPVPRAVATVLVIAVENLIWQDITPTRYPAVWKWLTTATIGSMSLHSARRSAPTEREMFATFGAGTRSYAAHHENSCRASAHVVACRDAPAIIAANRDALFGSVPFALGDALDRAGVQRSVVCAERLHHDVCDAALAIANSRGDISIGSFSARPAPNAVAPHRSVTVIAVATLSKFESMLVTTNGSLPADATIVLSPHTAGSTPSLTAFAIVAPGYLAPTIVYSPTTGRDGIVQMIDIAPTILGWLHIPVPSSMEGRPLSATASRGELFAEMADLRATNRDAQLRDRMIGGGVATLATLEILVVAVFVIALLGSHSAKAPKWLRSERTAIAIEVACLAAIAYVPATFIINALPMRDSSHLVFWPTLGAMTVVVSISTWFGSGRDTRRTMGSLCGATFVVIALDGCTGTHLSYNSLFGYSATAGGRFAGFGNTTFAFFVTAAVVLAGLLTKRSRLGAVALLLGAMLLDGAPMLGDDVGGALTMALVVVVFYAIVYGRRLWSAKVVAFSGVIGAALAIFALVDANRSRSAQTHLGRFVNSVRGQGDSEFWRVIHRKWNASMYLAGHSVATFTLPIVLVLFGFVWSRIPRTTRAEIGDDRSVRATAMGVVLIAIVGSLINDSGIVVAFGAFAIAVPAAIVALSSRLRTKVAGP